MEKIRLMIDMEKYKKAELLPFFGTSPEGECYGADNISLLKNGRRFMPVMGEIHFSRMEPECWEEELLKMKAGGVDIAATYVFWNHHQEKPGEWDFSGQRCLRDFLKTVKRTGLKCWLRIGPWAHGECRNGGFPDYVQHATDYEPRTNAPKYLALVDEFFSHIGEQAAGMMLKDGGPVIGVQLENEYGHCGGPADRSVQIAHMNMLKGMAIKHGLMVPYYTATAWGGACAPEGTLQVLSGYVDAPWDDSTEALPPQQNFLFQSYVDDHGTGSDFEKEAANQSMIRFNQPFLTAELGGGLQVTSHRRPIASAQDNASAILCCLGSGANLIGYYMYHGGTNPDGKYSNLNECQEVGGHTNVPVKNYDFNACLNEAGRPSASYGSLKKYHHLMHTFGEELSEALPCWPEVMPKDAADLEPLRLTVRYIPRTGVGYLFVNNHVRLSEMPEHRDVDVEINAGEKKILLQGLNFLPGKSYVIRFETDREGNAEYLNASVLCRLKDRIVYYSDGEESVDSADLTVLTEAEADRSFLFEDGLYITKYEDSIVLEKEGCKYVITEHAEEEITVYAADGSKKVLKVKTAADTETLTEEGFSESVLQDQGSLLEEEQEDGKVLSRTYTLEIPELAATDGEKIRMRVDYIGDRAEIYKDGKLAADWFTTGLPWYIDTKPLGISGAVTLKVYDSDNTIPCKFGQNVYYDLPVEKGCALKGVSFRKSYYKAVE